jgi:Peptidase family M28
LMGNLARDYPSRRPGSAGDDALAGAIAQSFQHRGFSVSTSSFSGRTVDGTRTLETVTGTRAGLAGGAIVVVAHRDALSSPATADLSGTATLLELARVLAGETQHRTIVLASTSGSAGTAGAAALARSIGIPVDAVIALGDLAGQRVRTPIVVPWSDSDRVAPPLLRNTVEGALGSQAALRPGGTSLAGQFAHLAFPLTISEQGPFGARGVPAVLLSVSGEHAPAADEATNPDRITALGRATLQTITALDGGVGVPAASPYLLYDGKVVPGWAIRLFVLALILPVLGAAIDGLARAWRRGHSITRGIAWVLVSAVPFALAVLLAVGTRLTNLISAAPPGPVDAGAVPLHAAGIAVIAALACVLVVSFVGLRQLRPAPDEGTSVAFVLVMCVTSLAIWVVNPFAAALLIPALHVWMWVVDPEIRLPVAVPVALLLAGLALPVAVIVYFAVALGLSPAGVPWNGLLLIAGGHVTLLAAIEWSVILGCAVSLLTIARRAAGQVEAEEASVTIRGPITYAGPGSLGGTESALRR